jgi:hypothetical protein
LQFTIRDKLEILDRKKRARRRSRNDRQPSGVPNTLVLLEKAIDRVTEKLGDAELCELTGTDGAISSFITSMTKLAVLT